MVKVIRNFICLTFLRGDRNFPLLLLFPKQLITEWEIKTVFFSRIEANIWKFQQITFPFSYLEELKNNINELIGEWGKHEYWDNGNAWPGFNFPMRENILWKVWNTNFPLSLRGRLEVGPLKTPKVVSWSLSKFNQCQGRFTKSFLQRNLLLRVGKHGLWLGKTKGMFYKQPNLNLI